MVKEQYQNPTLSIMFYKLNWPKWMQKYRWSLRAPMHAPGKTDPICLPPALNSQHKKHQTSSSHPDSHHQLPIHLNIQFHFSHLPNSQNHLLCLPSKARDPSLTKSPPHSFPEDTLASWFNKHLAFFWRLCFHPKFSHRGAVSFPSPSCQQAWK